MLSAPRHLTIGEGFVNPLGFHDPSPCFSWKLPKGVKAQTAYQLEVSNGWNSGWVESEQSVLVPYGGEPFESRGRAEWRVRFRDEAGNESEWSEFASFELGLLSAENWSAKWIRPAVEPADDCEPVAALRRGLEVRKAVEKARLYVTARGLFQISLDGQKVGGDEFANGWTSYNKRIDTLTYDVTDRLSSGEHQLQVLLGTGWYAGRIGWGDQTGFYGKSPELLLQLEITYVDGSSENVISDKSWQGTFDGPVVSSSLYDGENFDARREWTGWAPVIVSADTGLVRLMPKPFTPVREIDVLSVQAVTEPEPGRFVFDLGQNMVGRARLRVPMKKDGTVTVRFAEMLNPDGAVYTENYRSAKSTDTYTAAANGIIDWEPVFTFHGFRYVELSGFDAEAEPAADWVQGVVLHTDFPRIGKFESSHALLNQLYSNIVWGQRGNFLDIPTDCPQRDERLGWTGDAQVFCPTAMFNYDCHAFFKSWLGSMRDDQHSDGRIPFVIPDVLGKADSPGWMDAATFIPWEVYVRTGDLSVLEENFDMMKRLVDWYHSQSVDGLIPKLGGFGDWLQPYAGDIKGDTPLPLLGTAFFARSAGIVADAARLLNRPEAAQYAAMADEVRDAFAAHYLDAGGKLQNASETQTGYLIALVFGLVDPERVPMVGKHLARLVDEADGHLRTGFLGTPFITRELDRAGYPELALSVLFKETYPSWFYSIHQGATTMWERWNSYTHADGFGDVAMNSFNHYAYGAVCQWMVERLAGLAPDPENPGYKHFFVRPLIAPQLDRASAELETPYGTVSIGWKKTPDGIEMEITVPPNTAADVQFPNGEQKVLDPGNHRFVI